MRFYRVHLTSIGDSSAGYEWFTSEREAKSAAYHWTVGRNGEHEAYVMAVDVTPTRRGILAALRTLAGHPDNG